ncbi:MAG: hypothetical protein ACM3Q1_01635 [Bacteroidales bacterium]
MRPTPRSLAPLLLAAILLSPAALAQSSSRGHGSSSSAGGSSGSAKTESAPSGTLRTGPDRGPANAGGGSATMGGSSGSSATLGNSGSATLGAPGGGTAPGSSGRGGGWARAPQAGDTQQQARVPDECGGPLNDPRCPTASAPTGTGLGDRGTGGSDPRPYGPEQSPVKGGPPFTGPTGLPLNLPREGR